MGPHGKRGIEDEVHLASLIRDLDIRGTTPRIRALIRSTVEPEWSWLGRLSKIILMSWRTTRRLDYQPA